MSRTVTVLFDSRTEAELARERLAVDLRAQHTRIIAKDTLAAIEGLNIEKKDAFALRQALRRGAHAVIAEVPSGSTPDRIVSLLGLSTRSKDLPTAEATARRPMGYGIESTFAPSAPGDEKSENVADERAGQLPEEQANTPPPTNGGKHTEREAAPRRAADPVSSRTSGGLNGGYSSLTGAEAEAAGLFKERTIDFAEMREEAIVTKEAVVREEVIVTKTVDERAEKIRDTVRRTNFEVEQLDPR